MKLTLRQANNIKEVFNKKLIGMPFMSASGTIKISEILIVPSEEEDLAAFMKKYLKTRDNLHALSHFESEKYILKIIIEYDGSFFHEDFFEVLKAFNMDFDLKKFPPLRS